MCTCVYKASTSYSRCLCCFFIVKTLWLRSGQVYAQKHLGRVRKDYGLITRPLAGLGLPSAGDLPWRSRTSPHCTGAGSVVASLFRCAACNLPFFSPPSIREVLQPF